MPSPDVFVIPIVAWEQAIKTGQYLATPPLLAVEILSPAEDVSAKVHVYLGAKVEAVWVIDPALRAVFVYSRFDKRPYAEDSAISLPSPLNGSVNVDNIFSGCPN